ncbi:MAG: LPS assembly protein LptD [Pseudomonadales bacterium]|nr:LPS assembly protein LptD [Pseudomonadales bacterium]
MIEATFSRPHYYLDWMSPDDIAALPLSQRPQVLGVCKGAYVAPFPSAEENPADPKSLPIEATADHYESDALGKITLTGDVIIQQGNRQLESDQISIQQQTRETHLQGNVRIRQAGMLMTGETAELNLNDKNLSLENAEYVVHESHIRGTANKVYNENENTLVFEQSSYTTCEPNDNAWRFEANDIRLNKDSGWGTAKHAVVRVKDVPVFYFPWLMFPIDDRRQSGFLFPSFSRGEDNGTTIALPYYLNLAPNYDATITPRQMTERGSQLEGEFRYLTTFGEGELGAAYLADDAAYNDQSRDLMLWKHGGYFSKNWYTRIDYTRVSDQDYFSDLATSLNTKTQTHLDQEAELGYSQGDWRGLIKVERFQTLNKLIDDDNLPYRKMPQFKLNGTLGIADSGFYGLWKSEATRFEHPKEDFAGISEASRFTLSPGIEYRYRKPWAQVTPRLRVIQSHYDFSSDNPEQELREDQTLYTATLDSQLFLERSFAWGDTAFVQTLEPRLFYLYTPYKEQNHREVFDSGRFTFNYYQLFRENRFSGYDRYGDANQISLGVTSRFIEDALGTERFSVSVGQTFYLDDRRVQLDATTEAETTKRSSLAGLLEWYLTDRLHLRSDLLWDEEQNNLDQTSATLTYRPSNQGLLNLSYRYLDDGTNLSNSDKIKQTDLSFVWPVTDKWSLLGRWGYDMEYERSFENLVGVEYNSCCWQVRMVNRRYLKEDNNDPESVEAQQGIFLQFQLKGLGGVGNELDGVLSDSINGFEHREQLKSDLY